MIITYQRPDALEPHQIDPDAPPADLSPTGAECGRTTIDVQGAEWRCTRQPHPVQDEHRAAYDRDGDGPDGAVAIAWTYQYALTDRNIGDGIDRALPTRSLTVTLSFPERAAHGINVDVVTRSMINAALDYFWEGDLDDVTATTTLTP
ncbi:hypothetical protein [Subtercola vilae]|uniref:Uncharacterized protein n=1 Tax=Subtercola vilae TaxID=2056433 RepID=A0A4T2BX11_9MICO|nr:hypothetical protein [Subtercola vilae]TIH36147.1 hypothetical protein D4765_10195 [Subtercola vilae]